MKEKTFTVTVYSDPSNSWAKIKKQVLVSLGIADKISRHSYQFKDNAYLEEDCDLFLLHQTLDAQGVRLKYVEKHTDKQSRIRSYERYEYGEFCTDFEWWACDTGFYTHGTTTPTAQHHSLQQCAA